MLNLWFAKSFEDRIVPLLTFWNVCSLLQTPSCPEELKFGGIVREPCNIESLICQIVIRRLNYVTLDFLESFFCNSKIVTLYPQIGRLVIFFENIVQKFHFILLNCLLCFHFFMYCEFLKGTRASNLPFILICARPRLVNK